MMDLPTSPSILKNEYCKPIKMIDSINDATIKIYESEKIIKVEMIFDKNNINN